MTEGPQLTTLRQEANRKIALLNKHLSPLTNELYTVPPAPDVGHMTRMLGDFESLMGTVPEDEIDGELSTAAEGARARIARVREYLQNRADAK